MYAKHADELRDLVRRRARGALAWVLSGAQCHPVVDAGEVVEGRSVCCEEDPARGSRGRGDLQVVGSAGPSGAAGVCQQDCVMASDFEVER